MVSLDELVHPLRSIAPQAAISQLRQSYLEAARRFFTDSTVWREFATPTVGSTNDRYKLTSPISETEVFRVDAVWNDSNRLAYSATKQMAGTGTPTSFRDGATDLVVLHPKPSTDVSSQLTVLGMVRPTHDALSLNAEAVAHYDETLLLGARWHLHSMVAEWRDMDAAEYYRKLFQQRVDNERRYAVEGSYSQFLG